MNRPESLLGLRIDGYHLTKVLGSGRVADVYEAVSPAGERVALKLLRPDLENGDKAHARLAQEAEAVATIRHVNVVGYRGGGLFQGRLYILVDVVDGSTLRKRAAARGGLPLEQLLDFVRQAGDGVAAAHRRGILHRDLTPDNILINTEGVAKVADFGAAKMPSWGVKTTAEPDLITVRYRGPETLSRRYSPENDVFAMGVILYELASGTHPFAAEGIPVIDVTACLLAYTLPAPLATLGLEIPGDVSDLVQRALSPEPRDRGTMLSLVNALEAAQVPLRARTRADAQALPVPNQEVGMAKTESQMPQMDVSSATIPMSAAPPARRTTLPPVPAGPVTASAQARQAPAPTVPMAVVDPGLLDDRRSTGIPVEKAGPRPSAAGAAGTSRRWRSVVLLAGTVVVGTGLAATGWLLSGSAPPPAPGAPLVPPRASASSIPTTPPSASAPAPRGGPPGARVPTKKARP